MKICNICNLEKNINEFPKTQDNKGNTVYRNQCKKCWNEKLKSYREKNKDRIKANDKRSYINNRDIRLARQKIYREKNKDKIKAKARYAYYNDEKRQETIRKNNERYRKRNRERILIKNLEWKAKNYSHRVAVNKIWMQNNKDKVKGYMKNWINKHKDRRNAQNIVNNYLKKNPDFKPKKCLVCGKTGIRIEAHHTDYNKPLEVVWCCKSCHAKLDKIRKRSEELEQNQSN